jgi:hypothetical protein
VLKKNLSQHQLEGRLKNAIAQLLQARLIVPKVFFEAKWPTPNRKIDVLAIDRAGAGDIHCVKIVWSLASAYPVMPLLMAMPAHYKYVAILEKGGLPSLLERMDEFSLYPSDGIGRVGVISVSESSKDKRLLPVIAIEPERFRLNHKYYRQIDRFMGSHPADLEIRE